MVEWSITAVLKTAVPRGTGGSNPSLSAIRGINQVITRFIPLFLYLYVIIRSFNRGQILNISSIIVLLLAIVLIFQLVR